MRWRYCGSRKRVLNCKCKRDQPVGRRQRHSCFSRAVIEFEFAQSHVAGVLICKIALGSSLLAKAIAVQKQPRVTRLQGSKALDEFNHQAGDGPHTDDNQ